MKYLPLIWAALRRKPLRGVLTLLSVTVAFTLFGLMIGMNASFQRIVDLARRDIVFVDPRFGGDLSAAMRNKITRLPNVAQAGKIGWLGGYYQDPKNYVYAEMIDTGTPDVWGELPVTPERLKRLVQTRDGLFLSRFLSDRLHRKTGDTFTMVAPTMARADGTRSWTFHILDVLDDVPTWSGGFMFGNYDYFDKARPLSDQGKVSVIQVLVKDSDRATDTGLAVDRIYANSASPTRSISEAAAYTSGVQSGINIPVVTRNVAATGLFMILLLTANGIAQSVRERIPEFAVLKTLGFSDTGVMALVFVEAAVPCLLGAALGIGLAAALSTLIPRFIPRGWGIPVPYMSPAVLALALGAAVLLAFASAALPALRIRRLDVATALAKGV